MPAVAPDEADHIARTIWKNDVEHVDRAIMQLLTPYSATAAFDAFWTCQLSGEESKGLAVLKASAARGVPLPFDVK